MFATCLKSFDTVSGKNQLCSDFGHYKYNTVAKQVQYTQVWVQLSNLDTMAMYPYYSVVGTNRYFS